MQRATVGSHRIGGFDGPDLETIRCEPGSVTTGARTDVKDRRTRLREQIEQCRVYDLKRQRFVLSHQLGAFCS